jgi:hypothetical protein
MPNERLDDNVTVFVCGEFFPVLSIGKVENDQDEEGGGVLDDGHSYLIVND